MVVTLVAIMIMAGPVKANGDPYESAPAPPPPAPPASNLVSFLLGEEWTSPQGVAAAIGSGLVAELTGVITVPLTWAWRALFLVPDAIDPGRAPQVEQALAEVVGQSLTDPVFDAVGAANGVHKGKSRAGPRPADRTIHGLARRWGREGVAMNLAIAQPSSSSGPRASATAAGSGMTAW